LSLIEPILLHIFRSMFFLIYWIFWNMIAQECAHLLYIKACLIYCISEVFEFFSIKSFCFWIDVGFEWRPKVIIFILKSLLICFQLSKRWTEYYRNPIEKEALLDNDINSSIHIGNFFSLETFVIEVHLVCLLNSRLIQLISQNFTFFFLTLVIYTCFSHIIIIFSPFAYTSSITFW